MVGPSIEWLLQRLVTAANYVGTSKHSSFSSSDLSINCTPVDSSQHKCQFTYYTQHTYISLESVSLTRRLLVDQLCKQLNKRSSGWRMAASHDTPELTTHTWSTVCTLLRYLLTTWPLSTKSSLTTCVCLGSMERGLDARQDICTGTLLCT